ncbi:MAG TPA: hypothetical protein VGR51_07430 [Thermoplasmata archaeon]|nr:hypothetical protein [Thermoplasmata archaeon]
MSQDGVAEVVLGGVFTIVGLTTFLIPEIPVICWGAMLFGPIMLVSGFIKMGRGPRVQAPMGPWQYPAAPPVRPPSAPRPAMQPPQPAAGPPPQAGTELGAPCAKCGNRPPRGARFCNRCGAPTTPG